MLLLQCKCRILLWVWFRKHQLRGASYSAHTDMVSDMGPKLGLLSPMAVPPSTASLSSGHFPGPGLKQAEPPSAEEGTEFSCSKFISEAEAMANPVIVQKRMTWLYNFNKWCRALNLIWAPAWLLTDGGHHKTTEWQRLVGTSGGHLVQPPAQAGSPRAGCPGPCPDVKLNLPLKQL